jgi:hypothetical protein
MDGVVLEFIMLKAYGADIYNKHIIFRLSKSTTLLYFNALCDIHFLDILEVPNETNFFPIFCLPFV